MARQAKKPAMAGSPDLDPRIWGRRNRRFGPAGYGLIIVVILAIASYLAFTKHIPFTGHGYELNATFENATTLQPNSPVRIAGVNVGKVESVEAQGLAAKAKFNLKDEALPIHSDATLEIRPRLFLEGNFFIDLHPGSPSAPELKSGDTIPVTQTSTAVQLDEILTSLQGDTRANLRKLLAGFGDAFTHKPTAAEDATQDPDVQGLTAAEAINRSFAFGARSGRDTAIANTALLGEHPHDLSGLIRAQASLFGQLSSVDGDLKGLITNFNTTAGALADESSNVSASIRELAPTLEQAKPQLAAFSDALPSIRALALTLEPSLRPLPGTIRAGTPWLLQARSLLRKDELGYTARQLKQSTPALARVASDTPSLFNQSGLLARCVTNVLEPAGNVVVNDPFSTGHSNFDDFFFSLVQQAGESQNFDGNGQYLRLQAGGGPELVQSANPGGSFQQTKLFGNTIESPGGVQPALSTKPPYRTDVPCYTQDVPDINGPAAAAGAPNPSSVGP
jgi:phospholipid/cholesterol/gamma-HCH transport system substrate-binding protein